MACGTPVVVSTGGNATAGLDDAGRDTCLRVNGTSPHRWAQAISACLLAGPAALGDAGLARAREHDWPVVLELLSRRCVTLLRRHAGTGDRFPWVSSFTPSSTPGPAPGPAPSPTHRASPPPMTGGQRADARMRSSAPVQPRLTPRFVD